MGITVMEQIGIVAGIVTGVFGIVIGVSGFIYSIAQSRRQRKYELEQADYMREQAAKQAAFEREQAEKNELRDRLYFLANIIMDKDIPRKSRQIFFDEYVAKGGNGSFVKFWYDEEKEAESKKKNDR